MQFGVEVFLPNNGQFQGKKFVLNFENTPVTILEKKQPNMPIIDLSLDTSHHKDLYSTLRAWIQIYPLSCHLQEVRIDARDREKTNL